VIVHFCSRCNTHIATWGPRHGCCPRPAQLPALPHVAVIPTKPHRAAHAHESMHATSRMCHDSSITPHPRPTGSRSSRVEAHLIRRSPLLLVCSSAHCTYATGPLTMVSSWPICTAKLLSGSHVGSASRSVLQHGEKKKKKRGHTGDSRGYVATDNSWKKGCCVQLQHGKERKHGDTRRDTRRDTCGDNSGWQYGCRFAPRNEFTGDILTAAVLLL
jgi:hypothetical protein